MKKYLDRSHQSKIESFELGREFICIRLEGEASRIYTAESIGRENLDYMKYLAELGEGLQRYLEKNPQLANEFLRCKGCRCLVCGRLTHSAAC